MWRLDPHRAGKAPVQPDRFGRDKRRPAAMTRGRPSGHTGPSTGTADPRAVAKNETLVCITSIVTAPSAGVRAVPPGPVVAGAGAPWAHINTCTKTFVMPTVRPCAWADLPQARAIRAVPAGSTLQLVGRDLQQATVLPYVLEAVRAGAAVRLCFVATGVGEAERHSSLEHTAAQFTVADVLAVVAEEGRQLDVGKEPVCALCSKAAPPSLMRCVRCKCFWYCSKGCQTQHWSAHKTQCTRSMRAIKGSAAMVGTFCPLAQYHTAEAIPIPITAPPTAAARSARPAVVGKSIDTFQLKIRGIQQQIREFLDRQQRRAAEKDRGDRVRALENGSFIPLVDPTELLEWHRPSTPPAAAATAAPSSICCGPRQHDCTKLLPRLPPPQRDSAAIVSSTPLCNVFGAPAPRKRKWEHYIRGDSTSTQTDVSRSACRPRTDNCEDRAGFPSEQRHDETPASVNREAEPEAEKASLSPTQQPSPPSSSSLLPVPTVTAASMPSSDLRHSLGGDTTAVAAEVPQNIRLALIGNTLVRKLKSGKLRFLHVLGVEATTGYRSGSARHPLGARQVWTVRRADTAAGALMGIEQKTEWHELRHYVAVNPEHQALRLSSGTAMTTLFDSPSTIMHFDELPNPHLPLDLPTPDRPGAALCQQFKCKEFGIRPKETYQKGVRHSAYPKNCRTCVVKSVLQDSPAFHAGLTAGVQILKVNGHQVFDRKMPLAFIRKLSMSIPTGQKITLEVRTLTADEEARVL
eukprot:m.340044 g.340044  ORF g.340044 m.340044 type:complete len:747 (-) comp27824_c1_seq8:163-2403(-)